MQSRLQFKNNLSNGRTVKCNESYNFCIFKLFNIYY